MSAPVFNMPMTQHCMTIAHPGILVRVQIEWKLTMSQLESWASESNLLMNGDKTKQMLLTTPQMSKVHNLGEFIPSLSVGGQVVKKK